MKKFLIFLMTFMLALPSAEAQLSEKECKKEAKKMAKLLKKQGYEIFASSITLETALFIHNKNTLGVDGVAVQMGIASKCKSKNVGKQWAKQNACFSYAQSAGAHVKGRVAAEMRGNAVDENVEKDDSNKAENNANAEKKRDMDEIDNFYGAYTNEVNAEIKGVMKESYCLIKNNGDGTYEVQAYYIVNEDEALEARMRAMENALKESAVSQEHARKISEFVNEGFELAN